MNNKIIKTLIFITFVFILILINNTKTYAAMSNATITLNKTSFTYTGQAIKPTVTVKYNNKTLKKGTDYTLEYKNNINAGTATVTIKGKGNYKDTVKLTFTIDKLDISKYGTNFLDEKGNIVLNNGTNGYDLRHIYKYTGKSIEPKTSKEGIFKNLKKNVHYKISYSNNKKPGIGKITITGIGNCKGKLKYTFKIQ